MSSFDSSAKLKALRQMMLNQPSSEEKAFTVTISNGAKGEAYLPQEESGSDLSKYLKEMNPEEEDSECVTPFGGYLRGK